MEISLKRWETKTEEKENITVRLGGLTEPSVCECVCVSVCVCASAWTEGYKKNLRLLSICAEWEKKREEKKEMKEIEIKETKTET